MNGGPPIPTPAPTPTPTAAAGPGPGLLAGGLPPLHVPLRFFLTAALFGVLAGVLLAQEGEDAFATRWSPAMLATTHLLGLGFFVMVMFGALFQLIPVLGGTGVPRATLVASLVHPGLAVGALCLAGGLWRGVPALLVVALVGLALTFVVFVGAVANVLRRSRAPALRPLRWAIGAFVGTIALGFVMATALLAPGLGIAFRAFTNMHATWGGVGFGFLLVVGVSHQVVPMFHVTPPFPPRLVRLVPPLLGGALALLLVPLPGAGACAAVGITLGVVAHTLATMRLLAKRRRRRPDATVTAWRLGLGACTAGVLLVTATTLLPPAWWPDELANRCELAGGLLVALGGLGTIVLGMLPKIVAFLAFMHLQRRCFTSRAAAAHLPTMDELVGQRSAGLALGAHGLASALCVLAPFVAAPRRAAGIALAVDFAALFVILGLATLRYATAARRIAEQTTPA